MNLHAAMGNQTKGKGAATPPPQAARAQARALQGGATVTGPAQKGARHKGASPKTMKNTRGEGGGGQAAPRRIGHRKQHYNAIADK